MTQTHCADAVHVGPHRDIAIAIPARNEAATIVACLHAIDTAAARITPGVATVIVLVNNSDDATAMLARSAAMRNCRVVVEEIELSPGHAGAARTAALDRAVAMLPPTGIVMTTDADSEVAPDWMVANLAEIAAGADAVAGVVTFSAATLAALPSFGSARALEWRLADLHARLGTLIDPVAHDPWPNHIWAWGASLAATAAAYHAVGGMPSVPLAEDRAFAARIEAHDLRLRRSHAPVVYTSARRSGRAPGGFADLIDAYATTADTPCDAALEPTRVLVQRLRLRARCRAEGTSGFGARWAIIEATTPALQRQRLRPDALPAEVALAGRIIAALSPGATCRADIPASAPGA
ncbi:MAG: glycosyl transferase [Alphaproteobacteria bacterium]|nr:MAG: glycosyl transferase [Alphaproteobacteria bacterium]